MLYWKCTLCGKKVDTDYITTLTVDPDSQMVCMDCCEEETNKLKEVKHGCTEEEKEKNS